MSCMPKETDRLSGLAHELKHELVAGGIVDSDGNPLKEVLVRLPGGTTVICDPEAKHILVGRPGKDPNKMEQAIRGT